MSLRAKLGAAIAAITEWAGRLAAPATPWLFVALRRALVATVCWVVLACFFFLVPQSREVLHGLSEAPLRSIYDLNDEAQRLVNTWALLAYAAMSIVVSILIWYSARLSSSVDSEHAMPPALAQPPGRERVLRAMVWLPRILGVSALASCIGAFLYANYTPEFRHCVALALAIGAVAAPLLVAVAVLTPPASRSTRIVLAVVGLVVFAAVVAMLWSIDQKWRMKAWSVALALLPALLLVLLVKRRDIFVRLKLDASGMSPTTRQFGDEVATILVMLGLGALALPALAYMPTAIVRGFGSGATVLLFLASAVLALTALQLTLRRIARQVPGFTTATVIVALLLVAAFVTEPLGNEDVQLAGRVVEAKSSPAAPPGPRWHVNAWGGGLRAAVFTAQVLALADDATCGEFGSRIQAMSGVSGGSLGIATYLVARGEVVAAGGWQACAAGASKETPLTDTVTKALVQDHLSPVVAQMLAVDAWRLWGTASRGQALLDSWNEALVAALGRQDAPALRMRLADLTGGIAPAPFVYFNATDADTGGIVRFANQGDAADAALADAYPVGLAVLHSARFPVVSPAGRFAERGPSMRLVDGGYFDDSGATSLADAPAHAGGAVFVDIDGNPPETSICQQANDLSALPTAIRALLEAREARASDAVKRLDKPRHVRLDLEEAYGVKAVAGAHDSEACEKVRRAQHAPLGWYVSYGAANTIAASAQFNMEKLVDGLGLVRRQSLERIKAAK